MNTRARFYLAVLSAWPLVLVPKNAAGSPDRRKNRSIHDGNKIYGAGPDIRNFVAKHGEHAALPPRVFIVGSRARRERDADKTDGHGDGKIKNIVRGNTCGGTLSSCENTAHYCGLPPPLSLITWCRSAGWGRGRGRGGTKIDRPPSAAAKWVIVSPGAYRTPTRLHRCRDLNRTRYIIIMNNCRFFFIIYIISNVYGRNRRKNVIKEKKKRKNVKRNIIIFFFKNRGWAQISEF